MQRARERRTVMSFSAAAELTLLTITEDASPAAAPADPTGLSPRQRELVTLVARGRTDAQIAEQVYITVWTVRSHLDRIREKTGCRRRADLTRLALQNGLI
jgi:DNA-binding CsgD family transcriptional regulator